ncbi:MAG: 3-oxoacyl-ACP synthase III family protein [Candidatus Levyibacteriota bacterium]
MYSPDSRPSRGPLQEFRHIVEHREFPQLPTVKTSLYQPKRVLTNEEMVSWGLTSGTGKPLTAEGMEDLIGVKQRFIASPEETPLFMAMKAVEGLHPSGADVLLVSSSFPTGQDLAFRINDAYRLGVLPSNRLNIHMACSGFAAGLDWLHRQGKELEGARVLFVATEKYHPYLANLEDPESRERDPHMAQTIFSDGAAAVSFTLGEDLSILTAKSTDAFTREEDELLQMPVDFTLLKGQVLIKRAPVSPDGIVHMDGHHVLEKMARVIPDFTRSLVDDAGLNPSDIAAVLFHQGSRKITEWQAKKLKGEYGLVGRDQEDGNMSSASIPKLMDRLVREGSLHQGNTSVMVGFGAGLMAAGAVVRFGRAS